MMSESFKKAVLTKSGCDFNIDGMKLFPLSCFLLCRLLIVGYT